MLKVFGIKASRASRTLWVCHELGLQFDHEKVSFADDRTKTPEFWAVNPNGRIPAIDDDGFHLWESMAINIYLAKKHNSPLMPKDLQNEALVLQWSFWVMTEIEKPLLTAMLQRMPPPPDPRQEKFVRDRNPLIPELEAKSIAMLQKPFGVLNEHLNDRDYLLGNTFSIADLNVASVLSWANPAKLDLSSFPNVRNWLDRCLMRPAANQ